MIELCVNGARNSKMAELMCILKVAKDTKSFATDYLVERVYTVVRDNRMFNIDDFCENS